MPPFPLSSLARIILVSKRAALECCRRMALCGMLKVGIQVFIRPLLSQGVLKNSGETCESPPATCHAVS